MRIGISYTSRSAAEANLAAEIGRRDTVSTVASDARAEWRRALSSVEVAGGTDPNRAWGTAEADLPIYHTK